MNASGTPSHTLESASYTARQTMLAWVFHEEYDAVWEALESAVSMQGLGLISAARSEGVIIAKPPFSLLNFGRRIIVTLSRRKEGTFVRATSLHGLMALESKASRLALLDELMQRSLRALKHREQLEEQAEAAKETNHSQGGTSTAPAQAEKAPDTSQAVEHAAEKSQPEPENSAPPNPAEILQRAKREAAAKKETRPYRLGVGRGLIWFLVGTALAVGGLYLFDFFWSP